MIDEALVTAAEFAAMKHDLPEGGRWTELFAGRIITLHPPDEAHGNVVLNLSKAMARTYLPGTPFDGLACFDVGWLVSRDPDTILSPAMSYFAGRNAFDVLDEIYSERIPQLVCEIASTNDRRRLVAERVTAYFNRGVEVVWVMDPIEKCCHVHGLHLAPQKLDDWQTLHGGRLVPEFRLTVGDLFREPSWWR